MYETQSSPPIDHHDPVEHARLIAEAVDGVLEGKLRSTGDVTLAISAATTTLIDRRIGPFSFIGFMPQTANAAAGTIYVTAQGDGTATLNHANNAQADRTYRYLVIG